MHQTLSQPTISRRVGMTESDRSTAAQWSAAEFLGMYCACTHDGCKVIGTACGRTISDTFKTTSMYLAHIYLGKIIREKTPIESHTMPEYVTTNNNSVNKYVFSQIKYMGTFPTKNIIPGNIFWEKLFWAFFFTVWHIIQHTVQLCRRMQQEQPQPRNNNAHKAPPYEPKPQPQYNPLFGVV